VSVEKARTERKPRIKRVSRMKLKESGKMELKRSVSEPKEAHLK
jgi:hypothetical protein